MIGHEGGVGFAVALLASRNGKFGNVISMTIAAEERFILRLELVTG